MAHHGRDGALRTAAAHPAGCQCLLFHEERGYAGHAKLAGAGHRAAGAELRRALQQGEHGAAGARE